MKSNNLFEAIIKIVKFASPISAGALVNMVASFVAMLFVAQLGKFHLAAAALATTTFMTIMTISITIFYAVSILISHCLGQEKSHAEIGNIVKNGFWLAIILFIPNCIVLWNINKVLLLFGQDQQLILLSVPYFHYAALSMLPTLICAVILQFYTGIGKPKFTLIVTLINLPMMILLSYILIFGKFGFPQMGLAGVTCAGLIVQSALTIGLLFYLFLTDSVKHYQLFSGQLLPNMSISKHIFKLGFPIGIQFGGELAALTVSTYMMGLFGVVALAASQIVSQYSLLIIMITLGLSQAVSVLTSNAYGQHDFISIKKYMTAAMIILCILFVIITLLFVSIPTVLIRPYINIFDPSNDALIHLTIIFFIIEAVFLLVDGMRNLFSSVLRGLHDSKTPMHAGIICLWLISLPVSYYVGFHMSDSPIGLRIGFMSGFLIAALYLWFRIHCQLKIGMDLRRNS